MPPPSPRLAESLEVLAGLQQDGSRVFPSSALTRTHRDRLRRAGFVTPVIKGWWMATDPSARPGDTTAWYASFWDFCARYARARFGDRWHLSPEQSLLHHAGAAGVPRQVAIHAPDGKNNALDLPFDTGLFDYGIDRLPDSNLLTRKNDLILLTPAAALARVPASFYRRNAVEAQVALAGITDASELLSVLLAGDHSVVAGRLAGALRRIGRPEMADEISATMARAGHRVRESDPFDADRSVAGIGPRTPPLVARLEGMWDRMRDSVRAAFPDPPEMPSPDLYLRRVEATYDRDAYHSLSIEGYRVTPELIERVRSGAWDPELDAADRATRAALAARGYWLAFQRVKEGIGSIVSDRESAVQVVRDEHRAWYRDLFQPSVSAGILRPAQLAGYRSSPVYIQDSRHVPPRADQVGQAMPALFDLMEAEEHASVRAVLGHWMLGFIHPFPDGNGRVARFLMNAMLASAGYPWTVIRTEERGRYMAALESASVEQEIEPFATFLGDAVRQAAEEFAQVEPETT